MGCEELLGPQTRPQLLRGDCLAILVLNKQVHPKDNGLWFVAFSKAKNDVEFQGLTNPLPRCKSELNFALCIQVKNTSYITYPEIC